MCEGATARFVRDMAGRRYAKAKITGFMEDRIAEQLEPRGSSTMGRARLSGPRAADAGRLSEDIRLPAADRHTALARFDRPLVVRIRDKAAASIGLARRPRRPRVLVPKANMIMHEVADRLHSAPSGRRGAKQRRYPEFGTAGAIEIWSEQTSWCRLTTTSSRAAAVVGVTSVGLRPSLRRQRRKARARKGSILDANMGSRFDGV